MKKTLTPIIFLISLAIIMFLVFTKASGKTMSYEEALKLGEEKYLKFLWIVDGVFNSEKYNSDFIVNDKSLNTEDKIFTCKYKKNSNECIGNNFREEFDSLFSQNIRYDDVYSDGIIDSIISYDNNQYTFKIIDSCSINRMDVNQNIEVLEITDNKIIYKAVFKNNETNIINKKDFVLILEDNEWKISKAFYHDLCGTKYYIG